jgi:hypothetical protein
MCLAAIGIIGPILSAVGSVVGAMVSAAGAQQQADAEAQKAAYQAAVARNNATAEAYKGAEKAQDVAIKGDYALAKQRAAFGAAGVQIGTGTPLSVFGISAGRIAGDEQEAQYAGRIEAQRWQDQAKLYDLEAVNAQKAGKIAVAGALVGAIGGVGSAIGKIGGGGSGQALTAFG